MKPVRVGIIGANPDRGWGSAVHLPVIASVPSLTLRAVATTRAETAARSAERFGAAHAFTDPWELASHPEVDMVSVTVKAPEHYRLAMLAVEAGKHVYCEWPLAATVVQAEAMQRAADRAGVRAVVGLQARGAPVLRYLRDLVRDGYVGPLISVRLRCALPGGGRRRSREGLYVIDKDNGAGTLDVQGGHAIDALRFVVGELTGPAGVVANHFEMIEVIETGERHPKTAPDQLAANATLGHGTPVSISLSGGVVAGHGVEMELLGERGVLRVIGTSRLNFQMSPLTLWGAQAPEAELTQLAVPACYDPLWIPAGATGGAPYPGVEVPRATLVNVANLYDDFAHAITAGEPATPDFGVGLSLHRLIETLGRSSNEDNDEKD